VGHFLPGSKFQPPSWVQRSIGIGIGIGIGWSGSSGNCTVSSRIPIVVVVVVAGWFHIIIRREESKLHCLVENAVLIPEMTIPFLVEDMVNIIV